MGFFLKRYGTALRSHKQWALLALLPLALYLIVAAIAGVTYRVSQDFAPYSADLPLAASTSPIATIKLNKVVTEPDLLFLDTVALTQLQKTLGRQIDDRLPVDDGDLRRVAHRALSLSTTGDSGLRLSYPGRDLALGRLLVAFYSDRLMKRIADGATRARSGLAAAPPEFQPTGAIVVVGERSLWSAERRWPAAGVLLLSSLGVLALIAVFELADPSFKSERQIARYLGVPVLGALPDADPLVRTLPGVSNDSRII